MRFKKEMINFYVGNNVKEVVMSDFVKEGDYESELYEILDELTYMSEFTIPAKYCEDPDNCEDEEAYRYFDDLNKRLHLVDYLKECVARARKAYADVIKEWEAEEAKDKE